MGWWMLAHLLVVAIRGCCCSVPLSCPALCYPMDCSTPGFPVLHYHPDFAQTHIHWTDDAIQPSHPLLSPSSCPKAFPASGAFPMSWLFTSGGQNIGASVFPFMIGGAPVVPLSSWENKAIPSVLLPKPVHPCTSKYWRIISHFHFSSSILYHTLSLISLN